MRATQRPKIKICCIGSVEEARLAIKHGASALGLVSRMPSGPGVISEELIAEIAAAVPMHIATFLLTSDTDADAIIAQQRRTRVTTLQLVDRLPHGTYRALRDALPGIALVQVVHVRGRESVVEAAAIAPYVDAILLDSGNPELSVKELGGTGRVHDWQLSRQIRERIDRLVFLAGGLRPTTSAKPFAGSDLTRSISAPACAQTAIWMRLNSPRLSRQWRWPPSENRALSDCSKAD